MTDEARSVELVSVIINCRDGKSYLADALNSAFSQTYRNFEVILIDNCSTDGSADFAVAYNPDTKVFVCPEPMHLGAARNFGISKAKGELICFHDVDDTWVPDKLERQIEFMRKNDLDFCYAGVKEVTENGVFLRDFSPEFGCGDFLKRLLLDFDINMVTPMMKTSLVTPASEAFDPDFRASEEYNLFMRLAVSHRFGAMDEVLGKYTVREDSLTNEKLNFWYIERAKTLTALRKMLGPRLSAVQAEMDAARGRGFYYLACYLMSQKRIRRARKVMSAISWMDKRYRVLFWATFWPYGWQLLHKRNVKAVLLRMIKRLGFVR